MDRPHRVIGVGSPLMDLLVHVSESFVADIGADKGGMELVALERIEELLDLHDGPVIQHCGGSAANTIYGLAKLGMDVAFLGKLGHDDLADDFKHQYLSAGVSLDSFKHCTANASGRCLSLITPDTQRTMRTYLGAAATLTAADISVEDFEGFSHAHVEAYLLLNQDLGLKVIRCAKEAGCELSMGLSAFGVVEGKRELLTQLLKDDVDLVFGNEQEATAFAGSEDPNVCLDALIALCPTAAVTLGAKGALVERNGEREFWPGHPAQAVDQTGAGDLWSAGLIFGTLNEMGLKETGELASLLGALCVERHGARLPDDAWDRVRQTIHLGEQQT